MVVLDEHTGCAHLMWTEASPWPEAAMGPARPTSTFVSQSCDRGEAWSAPTNVR